MNKINQTTNQRKVNNQRKANTKSPCLQKQKKTGKGRNDLQQQQAKQEIVLQASKELKEIKRKK